MSNKPLDKEHRDKLSALMQSKTWRQTAKEWGIDRGTLAEAAQGLPKHASTRYMIEGKLKDIKL